MSMPHIDQIIRSRRKTIAIIIQPDGRLIVRAPWRVSEQRIRQIVESKSAWIARKTRELQQAQEQALLKREYRDGATFLYLGREYRLKLEPSAYTGLRFQEGFFLNPNEQPHAALLFEQWYRAAAQEILTERLRFYTHRFGLHYKKLRISSARTRWGSCSSHGTLSFTWRLVMAPLEVIDYVVVHELAHVRVQNHSAAFWAEVQQMMPDYKTHRDWLKRNGRFLSL